MMRVQVMWSTLPPAPPAEDLPLVDPDYNVRLLSASPCSPTFSFKQSVYAKLLAMRCSNRARDFASAGSNPKAPPSSQAPAQQQQEEGHAEEERAADAPETTFDVSPADEDRGLDYPQIDDIMTRSLQQRSNSIDQVLQDCGHSLTVPAQDYHHHHTPKGGVEGGRGCSQKCSPTHRGSLQPGEGAAHLGGNSPERDHCEVNGESSPSRQQQNGSPRLDGSSPSPDRGRLGQSQACPIPHCTVTLSRRWDLEESSETSSSYANVSVELGTADLSVEDFSSHHRRPSLQETADKEMQFSLSLDSNPTSPNSDSHAVKKEGEDEGYAGFFGSMKKLLASPKRRPADIVIPQEISSNQNSCSTTSSRDPGPGEGLHRRGQSDSGLSEGMGEGEASGSWSSSQATQGPRAPARPFIVLPPPQEFGNGNPFLMFLCLTLLLQHREQIVRSNMGYEDVAMFFDKMVRRHNVGKVLHQARELYSDYLRTQQTLAEEKEVEEYGLSV